MVSRDDVKDKLFNAGMEEQIAARRAFNDELLRAPDLQLGDDLMAVLDAASA